MELLVAQFVILGGALAANIVIARALGPDGRGRIALLLQLSYVIAVCATLGRDRSYPAMAGRRSLRDALADQVGIGALPTLLAGVLSIAVVAALRGQLALHVLDGVILAGLSFGVMAGRLTRAAAIVSDRPRAYLGAATVCQGSLVCALALLWASDSRSTAAWAGAYAVTGAVPFVVLVAVPALLGARAAGRITVVQSRIAFPTIAEMMVMRLDRVLLPLLASYSALGHYVVIATMTEITSWPAQQFADSRIPRWAGPGATVRECLRDSRAVLAGTLAVVAVGAVVIRLLTVPLFGSAYRSSTSLVLPLAIAAVGVAVYRLTFSVAIARRLTGITRVQGVGAAVLVAAAYPAMIAAWGASGAAWASVTALFGASLVPLAMLVRAMRQADGLTEPGEPS